MTCAMPACEAIALGAGHWPFLCAEHGLLLATEPVRVLPDLRGRCWGEAMTCTRPQEALTPHGAYCAVHRPGSVAAVAPRAALRVEEPASQEMLTAVANVMRGLGGSLLRVGRRYGPLELEPIRIPSRPCRRATPSVAVDVEPADPRVPTGARSMAKNAAPGWTVRLRAVHRPPSADPLDLIALEEFPSLLLKAWRGPLLLAVVWEHSKFHSAWIQRSQGVPDRLGAREAAVAIKETA